MVEEKKPNWKICMENQRKVDEYTFPNIDHSKISPLPTEPCKRCNGTGYKPQPPGYYGLSHCIYCSGSGKQLKLRSKS